MQKTILVVDDDEGVRNLLQTRLTNSNYNVLIAANGLHAVQVIGTGAKIDLMISDVNMPGMTGVQLVEKLFSESKSEFPVIMLSANRDRDIVIRAAKTGIVEYILKPFKYIEILEKIQKHLPLD